MLPVKCSTKSVTLENALERTGFGKFNYALNVLSGAILATVFLETASINFILPVAQCELQMTSQNKGLLSAVGFIGVIVSSHLWGFLADTRGRKMILTPTLLIAFVITIISSFTQSYWLLVLLRFANGFLFIYVWMFLLLPSNVCFDYYQPRLGNLYSNIRLAFRQWRLLMIVCALPSVLCGCFMLFMPESPKFVYAHGDERKTIEILQSIYKWNTGKSAESFGVTSLIKDEEFEEKNVEKINWIRFMWTQTVPLFKYPHLKNTLTVCFIQFCIFNTSNGFWTFFPEITNRIAIWERDASHVSSTVCQIIEDTNVIPNGNGSLCVTKLATSTFRNVFILGTIYCFGWLFLSLIINRVGKLIIVTTLLFTCGTCGFSLIFVDFPLVSSSLYIVLLAVGLTFTVVNASTVELFPTKLRAMALCLSMMFGRLGAVFGSNTIGALLDNYCAYTFVMPTILLISSGCLAFTIPNISNKISK